MNDVGLEVDEGGLHIGAAVAFDRGVLEDLEELVAGVVDVAQGLGEELAAVGLRGASEGAAVVVGRVRELAGDDAGGVAALLRLVRLERAPDGLHGVDELVQDVAGARVGRAA